jgi:signal transduction histidine kinase
VDSGLRTRRRSSSSAQPSQRRSQRAGEQPVERLAESSAESSTEGELAAAMKALGDISESLVQSHGELALRAERMERDLARTNRELADKVEELGRVQRHLEAILQALPTGVVVRDGEGRIARANEAALAVLGVPEQDLIGRSDHPGLGRPSADGGARELERPDGSRRMVCSRSSPIDAENPRAGSVEILDDRTELFELERRLATMDKLAALGNMAAGIAHEIRNPLHSIAGFAGLLSDELPETSRCGRFARSIQKSSAVANEILSSMLSLARPDSLQLETISGADLAQEAIRCACPPAQKSCASGWSVECFSEMETFAGDRIKLRQALRNLVANAIDAQPGGGQIRVEVFREKDDMVLAVDDAGPGVPDEHRQRIFEPFFTTNAQGTGLGLALVYRIAQLHGGRAELASTRSSLGGARFLIRIPFLNSPQRHEP